jgi:hypothetical protein
MKEEFDRLMKVFAERQEGKHIDLNEMLRQAVSFFNELKEAFLNAKTEQEKKEIMGMVNQMYAVLITQSKQIVQSSGMSNEEIAAYVQNPNNFTPDQWKLMESTREQIQSSSKEIAQYLRQNESEGTPQTPSSPKKEGERKKPSVPSRDQWMKS